jgi:hypothetical protein
MGHGMALRYQKGTELVMRMTHLFRSRINVYGHQSLGYLATKDRDNHFKVIAIDDSEGLI